MDPAIVLRTVVLMLVAYLAGSIPVGVLVARGRRRHGPADDRLGPDRRDERAAGARAAMGGGRRGRRPAQGRAAGPARALRDRATRWSRSCAARPPWPARSGRSSPGSAAAAASGPASGRCSSSSRSRSLLAAPVFIGVILLTRYVSLGSLLGSAAMFPAMLLVLLVVPETPLPYVIYSAVGAGAHLAGPRRQHRPPAPRHGAQVRPRPAGREAPERLSGRRRDVHAASSQ